MAAARSDLGGDSAFASVIYRIVPAILFRPNRFHVPAQSVHRRVATHNDHISPVKARMAAEWGLVNRVVPDAELVAETRKLAMQIVEASPLIIGDWQAGVLRADRSRYGEGVRLHERSDEPECDGVGRARRHRRIPGKAKTSLVRQVSRFNEEQAFLAILR